MGVSKGQEIVLTPSLYIVEGDIEMVSDSILLETCGTFFIHLYILD